MKTMTPKKIMTQEAKDMKDKVTASVPDAKELKQVLRGKIRTKIQLQDQYKESVLQCVVKETRLDAFKKAIEVAEKILEPIEKTVEWNETKMPITLAMAEYNLELHYFKRALQNKEYLAQGLRNIGFTDAQLTHIVEVGYIKDEAVLMKMEETVKKCADCGEDFIGEGELCTTCYAENKKNG